MAEILVVDDDENIRKMLSLFLRRSHSVSCVEGGEKALEHLENKKTDLIITDIMMPGLDGFTLVETIRSRGYSTPVIILTAKNDIADKCKGFASGTDDYMTKPVDFDELSWRIQALLRRSKIANEGKITVGDVVVDRNSFTVTKAGYEPITLPTKEFQLLFLLLSFPNQIFTKEKILDSVWGYSSESDEFTVRTHINRLRNKFETFPEFEIVTIRGIGYKAVIK